MRKKSKLMDSARYQEGVKRQPEGGWGSFQTLKFCSIALYVYIFPLMCCFVELERGGKSLIQAKKENFFFQSFCSVDIYVWNLTLLGSLPSCDLEQNICSLQWNYVSLWSSPTRHVTPSSGSTTNLVLQIQYLCNRASIRCFFCFIWPLQYFYLKILLYSDLEKVH